MHNMPGHVEFNSTISINDCLLTLPFLQGMELYPRIGKYFDIKVFTNCRFGMMSWAVLALTYCIKQVESQRLYYLYVVSLHR